MVTDEEILNGKKFMIHYQMNKEFIICAAIWINDGLVHEEQPVNIKTGFVIAGRRHGDCYRTIKSITGQSENERYGDLFNSMSDEEIRELSGFITSTNRYVNRQEAWKIAKANNQIQFGLVASDNGDESILISENLY